VGSFYSVHRSWWFCKGASIYFTGFLVCNIVGNMDRKNNRLFNGKQCSILQVVNKIQSMSFVWLKAKFSSVHLNYHGWWLSPFTILGIG